MNEVTVINKTKAKFGIYFDWPLNSRSGGPTGYLSTLFEGLSTLFNGAEVELISQPKPSQEHLPGAWGLPDGVPLFSEINNLYKYAALVENNKTLEEASYFAEMDKFRISDVAAKQIKKQCYEAIHAHTTVDLLKLHFSLTREGRRHVTKLILTSHCPEAPAKEWSEVAFANGADSQVAQKLYEVYTVLDRLAFMFADVLIFPCLEAMEPYRGSIPDFDRLYRHKPVYFVPTGSKTMPVKASRKDVRQKLGLSNAFVLGYIGRHNVVKGYDRLERLAEKLFQKYDDVSILVGGKAGPLPTVEHPRWIEYGWTKTPGDLVNAADVFVVPNQATYFDLIVLEALSLGAILILSRTGGNRYFEGKSSGIFLFSDDNEFMDIVAHLRAIPQEKYEALKQQNKALFEKNYTEEVFAQRYLNVLKEITAPLKRVKTVNSGRYSSPKVSIIVPVYNVASYVAQCIRSILEQSYTNFELLIVDDGSTDGSSEIIQTFLTDDRVQILTQTNKGLSAARNHALEKARGEWVSFIDGDDYLDPDFLKTLLDTCEKDKTEVAVCAIHEFDAEGTHYQDTIHDEIKFYGQASGSLINMSPFIPVTFYPSAWNKLYKRSLFDTIQYPVGFLYEDHPVHWEIMLRTERFSYIRRPLYFHRTDEKSRISRGGDRRNFEIFYIISYIYSLVCKDYGYYTAKHVIAQILQRLVWERSWSIVDPAIKHEMSWLFEIHRKLLEVCESELTGNRDWFIASDFIEEQYKYRSKLVQEKHASDRYHYPLRNRVSVTNRTAGPSAAVENLVHADWDAGSLLVHPHMGGTTIAEIFGMGGFGAARLLAVLSLENEQAPEIEVSVWASPFRVMDTSVFDEEPAESSLCIMPWRMLKGWQRVSIQAEIAHLTPTHWLYICSRVKKGGPVDAFAWLHVRKMAIAKIKPDFHNIV